MKLADSSADVKRSIVRVSNGLSQNVGWWVYEHAMTKKRRRDFRQEALDILFVLVTSVSGVDRAMPKSIRLFFLPQLETRSVPGQRHGAY